LWSSWREKAQALLRAPVSPPSPRQSSWYRAPDRSELVRILLWEGEVETAWQEAQTGGCSKDLWMQLAAAREQDHPEDSLLIYRRRIEPLIEPVTNGNYDEPIRLIAKVGELLKRLGREQEFRDYVQHIRTTYKRKRNLMKLLDTL
jgi:uncharacterized Zn finger protein